MLKFLGKYPGKTLHRIVVGLGGFCISVQMINFFSDKPNKLEYKIFINEIQKTK